MGYSTGYDRGSRTSTQSMQRTEEHGGPRMTFQEVLAQVIAWLQREQRVSYGGLKRQFALDDDYLEDLKDELIYAKHLAVDEAGRGLVWVSLLRQDTPPPPPRDGAPARRTEERRGR